MKHFEEEYRKYVHENTPDLWNRIEAGLAEKTEEHDRTAAHKVPDNWQIIENRLQEKTVETSDAKTQKRKPQYYLRGILTAAAGFFVIATAAVTLSMRQKSAEEAKNTEAVYQAEEAAAEYEMVGEAATEYDSAVETEAEYDLQYDTAEAPKDVYAETDETQNFLASGREDNIPTEEADYAAEEMIESEEMAAYVEEDADAAEPEVSMTLIAPVPVKELGIALAIPPTMTAQTLTTEEEEQGYICEYAGTFADGTTPANLTIRYIETEAETLDEYKKIIEEDDTTTDIKSASYSGIDFLEYTRPDKYCMLYYAENGTPVELSITSAASDSQIILQSITTITSD